MWLFIWIFPYQGLKFESSAKGGNFFSFESTLQIDNNIPSKDNLLLKLYRFLITNDASLLNSQIPRFQGFGLPSAIQRDRNAHLFFHILSFYWSSFQLVPLLISSKNLNSRIPLSLLPSLIPFIFFKFSLPTFFSPAVPMPWQFHQHSLKRIIN